MLWLSWGKPLPCYHELSCQVEWVPQSNGSHSRRNPHTFSRIVSCLATEPHSVSQCVGVSPTPTLEGLGVSEGHILLIGQAIACLRCYGNVCCYGYIM